MHTDDNVESIYLCLVWPLPEREEGMLHVMPDEQSAGGGIVRYFSRAVIVVMAGRGAWHGQSRYEPTPRSIAGNRNNES